jgi:site-specific recombinase XerD
VPIVKRKQQKKEGPLSWRTTFGRLEGAYSDATLRAYQTDIAIFVAWCEQAKRRPFPATPETVAAFVKEQADSIASSTIKRRLAAIRKIHLLLRLENPVADEEVLLARRRAYRRRLIRPRQALGLTHDLRDRLIGACSESLLGKRDKAMIAIGYDTLCRRSELVALRFEDIVPRATGSAQILIRRSKSDPYGVGRSGFLSAKTLQFLHEWRQAAGIENGYIFRRTRNGRVDKNSIHPFTVSRNLKILAERAGLPEQAIQSLSGHSMRVGAAQDMITSGMSVLPIMRAGGWKTVHVVARYVENADLESIMGKFCA